LSNDNTRGATGWCLEPHDLVLAKCVAGRQKDWAFAEEAIRHGLVEPDELRARLPLLPVDGDAAARLAESLEARVTRASAPRDPR
jgi:hypothetical protein